MSRDISIHTTLAGGDFRILLMRHQNSNFNPHHPRGWRRAVKVWGHADQYISIHTTLAGGDIYKFSFFIKQSYFNPHHPRGWRRAVVIPSASWELFQSTPPSRVATPDAKTSEANRQFQSTPPSRVATVGTEKEHRYGSDFNPHHPRGWRRH